ncbi:hypothetical protein [Orrella marina]|uniref:Uncharacterized protein n=1 Tax=Orrella marina TaxID=2163011 RepID=A0A2R4XN39_9BURK|nr:hypothetical protein [Orrella marina]AWB35191.1 hypothetical protein DBV39_17250 [Orrella marina]
MKDDDGTAPRATLKTTKHIIVDVDESELVDYFAMLRKQERTILRILEIVDAVGMPSDVPNMLKEIDELEIDAYVIAMLAEGWLGASYAAGVHVRTLVVRTPTSTSPGLRWCPRTGAQPSCLMAWSTS